MVIAAEHKDPAVLSRAGVVRSLQGVAGAVDAWALAVPHAEDAVIVATADHVELLGPPHGRRRQLLVNAWPEVDVALAKPVVGPPQGQVQHPERRAAVPRKNPAVRNPAAWSRRRWESRTRTRAWWPSRKTRPLSQR